MLLEVLLIAHVFARFPSNCCVAAAEPVLIVDIKIASQDNVRARLSRSFNACVSADLDPSRFWIPYDVTHCLGMRSSLKCRKVTYKMCVAHPRKWIRFLLASTYEYSFG